MEVLHGVQVAGCTYFAVWSCSAVVPCLATTNQVMQYMAHLLVWLLCYMQAVVLTVKELLPAVYQCPDSATASCSLTVADVTLIN
jgi:hypothetical protein